MPEICSVDVCKRDIHYKAKELCKGHYERLRRTGVLGGRIAFQGKVPKANCIHPICKNPAEIHNGFCRSHHTINRRRQILLMLVASLGGKCWRCEGTFHPAAYDFHHINPADKKDSKKDTVSYAITNGGGGAFDRGLEIASKCALLCANCHRIEHSWYSSEFVSIG